MIQTIRVEVPRAFKPLLAPRRYKGAYGGRGGAKSHFFAEQLVIRCFREPTRAVGIREIQLSIRDSVKQLLADKIQKFGLGQYFNVLDTEIRAHNGSNILFRGMQSYNAETIKSLEGIDVAWIEEGQTLSQHSLDLLRPTIRKAGSEIWSGWNPRYRTDPVDVFFRKADPNDPDIIAVNVGWRDNPWFPDVLRKDMLRDYANDPELAEHIWGGGYQIGHGAILARLIDRAEKDGRIGDHVEYDPKGPGIEISSDIGLRDTSTWWFWQRRVGGAAIIDYDRDSGLYADDWCNRLNARLKERGWKLDKIHLPHDAKNKTFAARYTAVEQFIQAFGEQRVDVVPVSTKQDRINAARTFVPKTEFNATRCERGIDGLRAWQFEWNEETQAFSREPLHDWACFVAGTMVDTLEGRRGIETLVSGDTVLTPAGARQVDAVYCYRALRLVEIKTADGRRVICTPNHKFFTATGMNDADALSYGDTLFTGKETAWRAIAWISRVAGTIGMHRVITDSCRRESNAARGSAIDNFIATCGHRITGLFRRAVRYITSTRIAGTTPSAILSASRSQITSAITGRQAGESQRHGIGQTKGGTFILHSGNGIGSLTERGVFATRDGRKRALLLPRKNGTPAKLGACGIPSTRNDLGASGARLHGLVRFVVRLLLRIGAARNTAGRIVRLRHFDADVPVYDLNVRHEHCYVANGFLVSNSHDGDGYSYGCQVMQGIAAPPSLPPPPKIVQVVMPGHEPPANQITLDELWAARKSKRERI